MVMTATTHLPLAAACLAVLSKWRVKLKPKSAACNAVRVKNTSEWTRSRCCNDRLDMLMHTAASSGTLGDRMESCVLNASEHADLQKTTENKITTNSSIVYYVIIDIIIIHLLLLLF